MLRIILVIAASLVSVQGIWHGHQEVIGRVKHATAILRRSWDTGKFEHQCTGAIISELYILTTALCSGDEILDIRVRVGSNYYNTGGHIHEVANIYQHPKFNSKLDYNIALLKLPNALKLTHHVGIAGLPKQDDTNMFPELLVCGWGYHGLEESTHSHLRCGDVWPLKINACPPAYQSLGVDIGNTDNVMCVRGDARPCEGDQSALLIDWRSRYTVYGLFSWHLGCVKPHDTFPIFTKLSSFRSWIDSYI